VKLLRLRLNRLANTFLMLQVLGLAASEVWRPVTGFERYEVSNLGRVRSKDTVHLDKRGIKQPIKGRMLKPCIDRHGYSYVKFRSAGRRRVFKQVHRLVAIAFVPGDHAKQVNHKNLNKQDNRDINLEWMTREENQEHARLMRYLLQEEMARAA